MEEFLAERAPGSPSTPRTGAWSRPTATRAGSWSSTRSTAPGRRWRASRPPASRSRSPSSETASRRWATWSRAASSRSSPARAFYAERGAGLDPAPALSANRDLGRMFWAYGLRGRPMRATIGGARRADRRLLGRRRHLRPRLGDLRHDPDRDRPARRLRRARAAHGRRRAGDARAVRAGRRRRRAQQQPLRPRRRRALPRGGRRGGQRRLRRSLADRPCSAPGRSSRSPASPPRTPICTHRSCASIERGIERLAARV